MPETFVCDGCNLEVPLDIPNFTNHFLNLCAGKILNQCQIEDCMQLFATQEDLFKHGETFHPEVNFYEETFVVLNEQTADTFCQENVLTPSETERISFEKPISDNSNSSYNSENQENNESFENLNNKPSKKPEKILKSVCQTCGKTYSRLRRLKAHMEKCSENREKPFRCTYENCKSTFTTKEHKRRHENEVHQTPVRCSYENCNIYLKPMSRKGHIKRFHANDKRVDFSDENAKKRVQRDEIFPCLHGNCGAAFATSRRLYEHVRNVHRTPKKCPYEWCDVFVKPINLRQHIIGVHEKCQKLCQRCNKSVAITNFYSHIKICEKTGKKK